ncbi:MAG: cell division protein FtsL [Spirochaetota bacterium]
MKRPLVVLLIILVPVLLFANVLQAFRYGRLEREIASLEREQLALLEENKRAILAITVLTSPRRVGDLAEGVLDLRRISSEGIIRLETPLERGGDRGDE